MAALNTAVLVTSGLFAARARTGGFLRLRAAPRWLSALTILLARLPGLAALAFR